MNQHFLPVSSNCDLVPSTYCNAKVSNHDWRGSGQTCANNHSSLFLTTQTKSNEFNQVGNGSSGSENRSKSQERSAKDSHISHSFSPLPSDPSSPHLSISLSFLSRCLYHSHFLLTWPSAKCPEYRIPPSVAKRAVHHRQTSKRRAKHHKPLGRFPKSRRTSRRCSLERHRSNGRNGRLVVVYKGQWLICG